MRSRAIIIGILAVGPILLAVLMIPRSAQAPAITCDPGLDHPLRYLALGDSYTIGQSVPEDQRFPVQLADRLRNRGVDVADPEIIAQTGWTTANLDEAITAVSPNGTYDIVTLLIGVNNQYQSRSLSEYQEQFEALLRRAIGFAGDDSTRVIVVSIPDYAYSPFAAQADTAAISADIDAFNAASLEISTRLGARYVSITEFSRALAGQPGAFASDGLHPSGDQYSGWASLIEPQVCAALTRR
jgi:lysophospholipase L1-like esterase